MFANGSLEVNRRGLPAAAIPTLTALLLLAACSSKGGQGSTGGSAGSGIDAGGLGGGGGSAGAAATGGAGGLGTMAGHDGGTASSGGASGACGAPIVDPEQVTGTPDWTAVAWAVYVAPIGTASDPPSTLNASASAVWAPNHAFDTTNSVFKSIIPHAPPYDGELATGLAQTTFVNTGCLPASAFVAPSGVLVSAILIPSATAPSGSSYEVATSGPIIPSALYVDGDLLRDGVVIDPAFDSTYTKALYLYPSSGAEGYRHVILNFAENSDFSGGAALIAGDYAFRVKISGGSGTGTTSQMIHFTVN